MRESSDDNWSEHDRVSEEEDYKEARKKVAEPQTVNEDGDLEDAETPDILDINADDWDQALAPLGVRHLLSFSATGR